MLLIEAPSQVGSADIEEEERRRNTVEMSMNPMVAARQARVNAVMATRPANGARTPSASSTVVNAMYTGPDRTARLFVIPMVDGGDGDGGGANAVAGGAGAGAGAVDNDAHASIYDPPAWLPPAQESPAYYSSVAAAPGTQAAYAELGDSAVYSGVEVGDVAAAYASPNEGGSAVYAGTGSGGSAAAYTPITNASGMYAPSGDVGVGNGAALYTNDAYGNVPGSSTTNA